MTNKFDDCLQEIKGVFMAHNSPDLLDIYHRLIRWDPVIREALEIASKLEDNPYAVTTQEPFEGPVYGSELLHMKIEWDKKRYPETTQKPFDIIDRKKLTEWTEKEKKDLQDLVDGNPTLQKNLEEFKKQLGPEPFYCSDCFGCGKCIDPAGE